MISAKIIADSISIHGDRITTWELEYPRFVHGELMTHRLFSRNAASSRAIPIDKTIELIEAAPAMPVEWGLNRSGMQAKEVHPHPATCAYAWIKAAKRAVESARELQSLGLHKQIVNRVLEPFQVMKTVVTATEFDNWFFLRNHSDAQPEIAALAKLMWEVYDKNEPVKLRAGHWHLPYVDWNCDSDGQYFLDEEITCLEEALKVSASCCAQVSYRLTDESLEKALKIYDMLVNSKPVHASPFEHQATPMEDPEVVDNLSWIFDEGVTHMDREFNLWSGNFKGWIQHRQLIKDNVCWNYKGE